MIIHRTALVALILLYSTATFAQMKLVDRNAGDLPSGLAYKGTIKDAVSWKDPLGEHIVITSETGIVESEPVGDADENRSAEIFAYHFILANGTVKQLWRIYDFVKECPFDVEAAFIENTLKITDLNKDNVPEIWVMYKIACRSDVSPSDMKVIMYQGQQKYALRGQNRVSGGQDENGKEVYFGGENQFDPAFEKGPKEFVTFAKTLWNDHIMQVWGDE